MFGRVLSRYLLRETALSWFAVTSALLIIMMATRLASVLNFAAKGDIPRDLLLQVTLLWSLRYLVILMPVSLLLAIMLSLGRLYSENEITAMKGCGLGLGGLYRPFLLFALLLALATGLLSFNIGPWAGRTADDLIKSASAVLRYNPFEAGKFRTVEGARGVFYTASVSSDGRRLGRVFAQLRQRDGDDTVLLAASGDQQVDAASGERQIILHDGWRYTGVPGQARFDVVQFKTLTLRAEPPPFVYVNSQRQLATTAALLARATPADLAELSGRLAAPLSVLVLALLAVPLSRLRPRQGRYTKVVLGVLVYLAYANLTGLSQHWIEKGRMSLLVGAGWVHLLALALALLLILHETGWRLRRQNGSPT